MKQIFSLDHTHALFKQQLLPHGLYLIQRPVGTGRVTVTQTLFNTDEEYEYLAMSYTDRTTTADAIFNFSGHEAEGSVTSTVSALSGFGIRNSEGVELHKVDFPQGFYPDNTAKPVLIQIGGRYYLQFSTSERAIIYGIDRAAGKVRQLCEPFEIRVSPRVVRQGENISVGHGLESANINVCGSDGTLRRTVKSAGGSPTEINTSNLRKGVNLVEVVTTGGQRTACKIIVE